MSAPQGLCTPLTSYGVTYYVTGFLTVKFYKIPISSSNDPETMVFFRGLPRPMSKNNLKECLESEMSMVPSTTIKHNTQPAHSLYLLKKQKSSLKISFSFIQQL
jgi:hypothetical protein